MTNTGSLGGDPFLSVVIPAYNEEERLPATLERTLTFLRAQDYRSEVIVVSDGSTDDTARLVTQLAHREPGLRLLEYAPNRGKGHAVRYGMARAVGTIRLFMDADNSTSIDHVSKFLPYFGEGYDVVIGSRRAELADVRVHQPWWKECLGTLGNRWIRFWAVPGIRDTQAGFKAFSARAADDVFLRLRLDGWGFDIEALAVCQQLGYEITEQPIVWMNDPASKVSMKAYLHVLLEVLQVRRDLRSGSYRTFKARSDVRRPEERGI